MLSFKKYILFQTELSERLRLRRGRGDTSEDDEGLPRSPCNSPTTTDGLLEKSNKVKDMSAYSRSNKIKLYCQFLEYSC